MLFEALVVAAFGLAAYEYITNASFKAKVKADFQTLEIQYPNFKSRVTGTIQKIVAAAEAEVKKL